MKEKNTISENVLLWISYFFILAAFFAFLDGDHTKAQAYVATVLAIQANYRIGKIERKKTEK